MVKLKTWKDGKSEAHGSETVGEMVKTQKMR